MPFERSNREHSEGLANYPVAALFASWLVREGFRPFLSGGAALRLLGGVRSPQDFDFRIVVGDRGVFDLRESGDALRHALNGVVRRLHARPPDEDDLSGECTRYRPLGGRKKFWHMGPGGLTVGSRDFLGTEVSLSIGSERQPTREVPLPRSEHEAADEIRAPRGVESVCSAVSVLTLEELGADKLKAMTSRRKWGEANIKKVSQDLFDFLDTAVLRGMAGPSAVMDGVLRRAEEYRGANLSGRNLHHLSDEVLVERFTTEVVLTARAHGSGARGESFARLCREAGTRGVAIERERQRICAMRNSPSALRELRPEYRAWAANLGPPRGRPRWLELRRPSSSWTEPSVAELYPEQYRRGTRVEIRNLRVRDPETGHLARFAQVRMGAPFVVRRTHAAQVLTVLYRSDGLERHVGDFGRDFDARRAFDLSAQHLGDARRVLEAFGLVEPTPRGLRLTHFGLESLHETSLGRTTFPRPTWPNSSG